MFYQDMKTPTEQFLANGWFYTNNAELIAQILMEVKDMDIKVKGINAGDCEYAIAIA